MQVHVGLRSYSPWELGFSSYNKQKVGLFDEEALYVHTLIRGGVPLVIVSERDTISVYDFQFAETPRLDYPTSPFLRMLRILKQQYNEYLDKLSEALRRCDSKDHCSIPCGLVSYIEDLAGLIAFSLQRRGVDARIHVGCGGSPDVSLKRIEKWIDKASEPAPYLGSSWFIRIAYDAYELFKPLVLLFRLYRVRGCYCPI